MERPASPLDVRRLDDTARVDAILSAFDELKAGEAIVVIDGRAPSAWTGLLVERHPDGVDWSSLETGPDRYRTEIRRRAPGSPRSVSGYLGQDHDRLDEILPDVERRLAAGDVAGARERFAEFTCGLDRHIEAEEQVLFPDVERRTGMIGGPTAVMRAEHVEIRAWMAGAADALAAEDASGFRAALQRLRSVLVQHNMKEEHVLYPMSEQAASEAGAQESLVRRMQALL
jgi:uncharacterized protein (DUF2249 family)/hemerythrin-like domain-containing protein